MLFSTFCNATYLFDIITLLIIISKYESTRSSGKFIYAACENRDYIVQVSSIHSKVYTYTLVFFITGIIGLRSFFYRFLKKKLKKNRKSQMSIYYYYYFIIFIKSNFYSIQKMLT